MAKQANRAAMFYRLASICAVLLAAGILLPYAMQALLGSQPVPTIVLNVLQIGGLLGLIIFYVAYRMTRGSRQAE